MRLSGLLLSVVLVAGLSAGLWGCAGQPGYINIPAQSANVASSDPNGRLARRVQAEALGYSLKRQPVEGSVGLVLPEGSEPETYAWVAQELGEQVVPADEVDDERGVVMLRVDAVRVRAMQGQVDLVRTGVGGHERMQTVYLESRPFGRWMAQRSRTWRGAAS